MDATELRKGCCWPPPLSSLLCSPCSLHLLFFSTTLSFAYETRQHHASNICSQPWDSRLPRNKERGKSNFRDQKKYPLFSVITTFNFCKFWFKRKWAHFAPFLLAKEEDFSDLLQNTKHKNTAIRNRYKSETKTKTECIFIFTVQQRSMAWRRLMWSNMTWNKWKRVRARWNKVLIPYSIPCILISMLISTFLEGKIFLWSHFLPKVL